MFYAKIRETLTIYIVGVGAARDLFSTLHDHGVDKVILASLSGFTGPTYEFVQGEPKVIRFG